MVPPTCPSKKKKFRWTARVRTWSSPPSSARTSSILLDAPFSKCQGLTRKYYGPTIQPTTLTTPTNPSTQQTYPPTPPKTLNHEGGVPQKSSESKKVLEWSPLLVCQKNLNHPLGLTLSTPSLVYSTFLNLLKCVSLYIICECWLNVREIDSGVLLYFES